MPTPVYINGFNKIKRISSDLEEIALKDKLINKYLGITAATLLGLGTMFMINYQDKEKNLKPLIYNKTNQDIEEDKRSQELENIIKGELTNEVSNNFNDPYHKHILKTMGTYGTLTFFALGFIAYNLKRENKYLNKIINAEKELLVEAEKYKELTDSIKDIIFEIKLPELKYTFVNNSMEKITGYKPEELIGTSIVSHLTSNSLEKILDMVEKSKDQVNQKTRFEVERYNKYGEKIILEAEFSIIYDTYGAPTFLRGVSRDLTDWKKLEKLSEEIYMRHLLSIHHMSTGFALHKMIYDTDGNAIDYEFLETNPSFERITNLKPHIGQRISDFLPKEELIKWTEKYEQIIKNNQELKFEEYSQSLGKWFSIIAYQTQKDEFAAIIEDITEQKDLDEKLRQTQKMESIGILAGGIAHDFNNILTTMMGYSEIIKLDKNATEDIKTHVNEVLKSGERAKDLVKQILMFSRRDETEIQSINIEGIINETSKFLRATLPKTIELKINKGVDDYFVKGDYIQIQQVVMNLITNAYQAMENDEGKIEISLNKGNLPKKLAKEHQLSQGEYVMFKIKDNGSGIPKNIMDKIFDPWFTTKNNPTKKGTGLGLSIVYGIIKRYEGTITVKSEENKGTEFDIYLPSSNKRIEQIIKEDHVELNGKGRILIVDDEIQILDILKKVIEKSGYHVDAYTNPLKAEESIKQGMSKGLRYDLIMTDMQMPQLKGTELIKRAKEIDSDISTIIMTGHSEYMDQNKAKSMNIGYVSKPFKFEEITLEIDKVLKSK